MHKRLENWFGRFGEFITHNPFKVIIFALLVIAFPISNVPKIKMDTSTEGFMHPDDPMLIAYDKFKEQFGRDERIVVAINSKDIFTLKNLQKLKKLHDELENNLPYLEDITSLINVRNTRGEGDKLLVDDLMEKFPKTKEEVQKIKKIALDSELYRNLLINKNGTFTTIVIETKAYVSEENKNVDEMLSEFDDAPQKEVKKTPLSDEQNSMIVRKVKEIVDKYNGEDFKIYYAGSPSVLDALKSMMKADMQKFTRITILIVLVFLFVIFRRVSATFYPLLVIVLALLTTVGTMAFFDVAFKLPTQIVPSLILAVSIGANVHILSIFFTEFNKSKDKAKSLIFTMQHSGLAIAMTGITTAIGIASFSGSEVAPVSDMGIFASLGVLVSLFLTLTLLPALLMITKLQPKENAKAGKIDFLMQKLAYLPTHYPKLIFVSSMAVVLISLFLATKLRVSHYPLEWFPKDDHNYVATKLIDKTMRGTLTTEVVLDLKKQDGWKEPSELKKLDRVAKELDGYDDGKIFIGKVFSLNNIIKESNRALHENKQSYYKVPDDKALTSQELFLFENSGSDDLEDVVDTQFSKVRVTHKMPWKDSWDFLGMLKHIKDVYAKNFPEATVTVTGMIPLLVNTLTQSISSSIESYIIAFVLISISMMFIMGGVRLGLISMIPNLTPIIMGLSLMYYFHIPLDMFTLLIGSIAIGLAVDDTIHFMHNFRRYYLESGDASEAVRHTFFTTGKAMVITSIVLSLGFYSYMMGTMESVQNFGFLTGSVIIFALLADLLLAPALMVLISKRGWIK